MSIRIKNALPGVLDLSPVKDVKGHTVTLRGAEERDIPDVELGHPVIQRVLHAQWLTLVERKPARVVVPVIKTEAPPEELTLPTIPDDKHEEPTAATSAVVTPEPVVEPVTAPGELPVETTVVEETPLVKSEETPVEDSTSRSGKSSGKSSRRS